MLGRAWRAIADSRACGIVVAAGALCTVRKGAEQQLLAGVCRSILARGTEHTAMVWLGSPSGQARYYASRQ